MKAGSPLRECDPMPRNFVLESQRKAEIADSTSPVFKATFKLYLGQQIGKCLVIVYLEDTGEFFHSLASSLVAAAAAKSFRSCPTLRPHRRQPTRLPRPWDSPGKNTGVGCHFLLQSLVVSLL